MSKNLPSAKPVRGRQLGERASPHQLHRDEVQAVGLFDRMHGDDVRMIERGDGFGFSREPHATLGISGQLRRQDLEGDLTIEAGVLRQIDLAHAAGADRLDDPVVSDGLAGHQCSVGALPAGR